jgi:hypothetical protein
MPKHRLITYTNPESVKMIMSIMGSGTGILNTDAGLFVMNEDHPKGKTYPKGTVFAVEKGKIKEWTKNETY